VKMLSTQTKKSRIQPGALLGTRPILRTTPAGFFIGDNMKRIPLTQGKFAIVDNIDFEWLSKWKWYALKKHNTFYAVRGVRQNGKTKRIHMHREIMHALPNEEVDHRNHNGLANWQDNLRTCTHAENTCNQRPHKGCSSKYKGVSWHKYSCKWQAYIRKNYKNYCLGFFVSEINAAKAYDVAAKERFGEFAHINF